ncbi:type IV toxin-antitoxin system AbiEi family antitoxin domain-containing protein [Geodermatophilus sp. URMC 62]|uniref:type IV toxin-antitoxin system AbiEi family antitoxin domain-containing protein n=1 Tax=Geodermatophilus sp. URMC 62 TaxID=3423414 RepID=UPI00406D0B35
MDPLLPPDLLLRRDALPAGWSDEELTARLRRGELTRLRPGAYLVDAATVDAVRRHRHLVAATVAALRRPAVLSHQSAAVLWGMPLWGVALGRVHVTRRPPASNEVGRYRCCHVARLREDEVTTVDGVAVTTPVRTALDLARALPAEPAVVVLDAALRLGLVERRDLEAELAGLTGVPGARRAARAVALADGRSESVGESRSRVLLHRLGMPPSTLQLPIRAGDGRLLGRVDVAWEDARVVGEFDGRVKYGRLLRPGQDAGDAVFEEKRREDALRDEGWGVVRWTWADLTPQVLGPRVRRALERGRSRHV